MDMKINFLNSPNFSSVNKKVHTKSPILIEENINSSSVNDGITFAIFGRTNSEIENETGMTDIQKELKSIEYQKLITKQQVARTRSGNIYTRLKDMDRCGYLDLKSDVSKEILYALSSLKQETISALNDSQLYRICKFDNGNRKVVDGLLALEKEFTVEELQKISERDSSTIINTWISKLVSDETAFAKLTDYIHELARK